MLKIGDEVTTELRADGPKVSGVVTGIYETGQFVELRWESRDGRKHTGMFEAAECRKVEKGVG